MKRLYNSHLFNPRVSWMICSQRQFQGRVFHGIIDKLGMIDIYAPT